MNQKLLVDKHCLVSNAFVNTLVKLKVAPSQLMTTYQEITSQDAQHIDMQRAQNEVALYEVGTTKVTYGVAAIIKVMSGNHRKVENLLKWPIIYQIICFIYGLIAYNRNVFYPKQIPETIRKCVPTEHSFFRWTYLIGVAALTGIILNQYVFHINQTLGLEHDWLREYYICFGQIAWQLVAIQLIDRSQTTTYLGNMSTVSLIGGILLLPILLLHHWFSLPLLGLVGGFGLVVGIMFLEHIRRCKVLGLPLWMTFSWVLYRTVVLALVILFYWLG